MRLLNGGVEAGRSIDAGESGYEAMSVVVIPDEAIPPHLRNREDQLNHHPRMRSHDGFGNTRAPDGAVRFQPGPRTDL